MSFAWHVIRDHLMQSSSTLGFQRDFEAIRRAHDRLEQFSDPAALLDALHSGSGDAHSKNQILSALIEAAQGRGSVSGCALTLLLLALWPGLDAIRRRSISRRLGTTEEIVSDVLARSTETIRCLDLGRVHRIAATVLRNIERDMIRARQREVERANTVIDIDPDEVPVDLATQQSEAGDARLRDDLRKMIGGDAVLVTRVAIEGFSQAEVALELGVSEAATRKRYQRATRRLRDLLQERVVPMAPAERHLWCSSNC